MSRFQKGDVVRLKGKSEIVSRKLPQWDDERALRSLERLYGRTATVSMPELPLSSDRLIQASLDNEGGIITASEDWFDLVRPAAKQQEESSPLSSSAEKELPAQLVTLRARAYGVMVDGVMEVETRVETLESGEEIIVVDGPITRQNHETVINAIQAMVNDLSAEKKDV